MRAVGYFLVIGTLTVLLLATTFGQISITSSDVSTYMSPGMTYTSRTDTATNTFNIGSLGATSWDFSSLISYTTLAATTIRPDTSAFFSMYPNATHAFKAGTIISYYALGSNLEFLGVAQPPPNPLHTRDVPPHVLMQKPMTYGTSWTSTFAESTLVTIGGTTYVTLTNNVVNYTVDAFGNMTLPSAGTHAALRVRQERITSGTGFSTKIILYQFMAKNGVSATVVPSDTNQPSTGVINVSSISWSLPPGLTAIDEPAGTSPSEFLLKQNYPNPFNPTTNFEFSIRHSAQVRLEIFDVLGRSVAVVVNEELPAGEYTRQWDASTMPGGIYYYRLTAGAALETRKLVLLR